MPRTILGPYTGAAYEASDFPAQINAASLPMIPYPGALSSDGQVRQAVVRATGTNGKPSLLTYTDEEIMLRASIDVLKPQLNEKNAAKITKLWNSATTHVKGKNKGKPRKVSAKNLLKVSMIARALLAKQQAIEARYAYRSDMAGVRSLVGHVGGKRRGWVQRAYGRAQRASQKRLRAGLLNGRFTLNGDAQRGAQAVATATRKRFLRKISKEKGVGAQLLEQASAAVQRTTEVTSGSGATRGEQRAAARAAAAANAAAEAAAAARANAPMAEADLINLNQP